MSNYGQDVLNDGLERLEGTWEYAGEEYDLVVDDISYPDFKLAQEYAAISAQVNALENAESIDESDVEEIQASAEGLDNFSWEDSGDEDFIVTMIDAKLVKPEVDIDTTPVRKLRALLEGMFETWQSDKEVESAREEMPLEGNP